MKNVIETPVETTELEAVRTELHTLINQINKPEVLKAMQLLLEPLVPQVDIWSELGPEAQAMIQRSLASVEAGRTISGEKFLEKLSRL